MLPKSISSSPSIGLILKIDPEIGKWIQPAKIKHRWHFGILDCRSCPHSGPTQSHSETVLTMIASSTAPAQNTTSNRVTQTRPLSPPVAVLVSSSKSFVNQAASPASTSPGISSMSAESTMFQGLPTPA